MVYRYIIISILKHLYKSDAPQFSILKHEQKLNAPQFSILQHQKKLHHNSVFTNSISTFKLCLVIFQTTKIYIIHQLSEVQSTLHLVL